MAELCRGVRWGGPRSWSSSGRAPFMGPIHAQRSRYSLKEIGLFFSKQQQQSEHTENGEQ